MKVVLHYVFLVGIPILGVLGLLQIGSSLKSPTSIGGGWHLELTTSTLSDAGCANLFDSAVQPILTISQSGIYLILELNTVEKTSFKGMLNELTITTTQNKSGTAVFQATVDHQSEPNRLTGTLTLPTCKTPLTLTGIH